MRKMDRLGNDTVRADVDYSIDMIFGTGSVSSQTVGGDELTEDQWNQVVFEIDASANASQTAYLELVVDVVLAGTTTAYFDCFMLLLGTDREDLVAGVEVL